MEISWEIELFWERKCRQSAWKHLRFGSPGRIRTAGQAINSRLLYR